MRYLYTLIFTTLFMLSVPAGAGPVDINTASADVLAAAIDGVGEKKAAVIIRYREANGPFASVDELANVKGIGSGTVERNRHNLRVAPAARQAPAPES